MQKLKYNKLVKNAIYILVALIGFSNGLKAQVSYSLEQCKELALKNNAKIKNAALSIDMAAQQKGEAYTKYFPQVSGQIAGMYAFKDLVQMDQKGGNLPVYDGNPVNLQHPTQFAYMPDTKISMLDKLFVSNLMIMQPVYAGNRISTGNALAELSKDINKDKYNIEKYNVCEKTEELYWQVIALIEKEKTVDFYIAYLEKLETDVQNMRDAGLIGKNDVLKVSIKLNELNINKLKLQNGIELSKEALSQHIGVSYSSNMQFTDSVLVDKSPEAYFADENQSINKKYEMNLVNKAVQAEKLQTDLKKGEYLPQVSVGAVLMYMNVLDKSSANAMLLANVSVPISGWWEASYTLQERKIQEEMINNTQKETAELLGLQISQTWKTLNENYQKISMGNKMLEQAQENFKENESNYKAGLIGISDLLEAQALVQQSQDQLVEFKTNYKLSLTKYLQAVGNY